MRSGPYIKKVHFFFHIHSKYRRERIKKTRGNMEKIKKFNWLIIILLICIIKIYFTSVQDINTRTLAEYDDALMIK